MHAAGGKLQKKTQKRRVEKDAVRARVKIIPLEQSCVVIIDLCAFTCVCVGGFGILSGVFCYFTHDAQMFSWKQQLNVVFLLSIQIEFM